MQRLQLGARVDPELVDQRGTRGCVRIERLGLPPGAVEREHQLSAQSFPQGVLANQRFELADQLGAAAALEFCIVPRLEGGEPELFEPRDLGLRPALVREVGEGRPAPQLERRGKLGRALGGANLEAAPSRRSNSALSSCPGARSRRYPLASVAIVSGPSVLRSCETYPWIAVCGRPGASSGHSASMSVSVVTVRPLSSASTPSTARCLLPPSGSAAPSRHAASGPRSPSWMLPRAAILRGDRR